MEVLYQPGYIIRDRYRIVGVLGEGGTAITYEAIDLESEKLSVAIKVLSLRQAQDWKILELFEREVRVLKNLNHPKIPQYLDYFSLDTSVDRQFFLVQELIPGKSLASLVEQGWYFQEAEVKDIAEQILEILTYLHSFQPPVIHRDIKPHNIIRTDDGEIYLVDLGAVQDVYRNTLTRGATFVGTIDYMSPEQLRGHADCGSDLYSLGCTLLYLLTRRSPSELPLQRMKINFRSCLQISQQFADWLDILLEPALEDRFHSTQEALKQLKSEQSSLIKPLVGSLIEIKKKSNNLMIYIPPKRKLVRTALKPATEFMLSSIVILLTFSSAFSLIYFTLSNFSLLLLIFTTFIWGLFLVAVTVFVTTGFNLLFLFFGRTYLKIEPKKFKIIWKCLGIKRKILEHTASIEAVTVTQRKSDKESVFLAHEDCIVYSGTKEYKFGMWLTKAERRWLVTEIANFIVEQYPNKNKEDWLRDLWKFD